MKFVIRNIKLEMGNIKHHSGKIKDENKIHMKKKEHYCEVDNMEKPTKAILRCNLSLENQIGDGKYQTPCG